MNNQDQEKQLNQLLSKFLHEIKEENEQLQIRLKEQQLSQSKQEFVTRPVPNEAIKNESKANYIPKYKMEDQLETSTEGQIFHLYQNGYSKEEIAKKLNRGKTEVELILKMNKN